MTYEENGQMTYKDDVGNEYLLFPKTKIECVDGLEEELTTKDDHIANEENPHNVTAEQVGARPEDWMPTAADVGAATEKYVNDRTLIATDPNNDGNIVFSYGGTVEGGGSDGGSGTGADGKDGEDGGYYKPSVSEDGTLSWTPSKSDMPSVGSSNIKGADGHTPVKGEDYFTKEDKDELVEAVKAEIGDTTATVTGVSITEATDGSVTMVNTLSDGSTETIVISADADGNPSGLTYNGIAIPLTYTKETGVSE